MKAMRIPVIAFEKKQEAEILSSALNLYKKYSSEYGWSIEKVEAMRDEIQKIVIIFEKTNNN